MPLSDEELRLLEQMERALVAEDPKFVSLIRGTDRRRAIRYRVIGASAGLVGGVAILLAGVAWRTTLLGLVGFVLMLAATVVAVGVLRHRRLAVPSPDFEAAMFRHPSHGGGADPEARHFRDRWGDRWWRRDDPH